MRKICLTILSVISLSVTQAQFYAGRSYTFLEAQINRISPQKVEILKAPLEYDNIADFKGHKIQFVYVPFVVIFVVKVNANGVITECVNYLTYDTRNKELTKIVAEEREKAFYKYSTLKGKFINDGEYRVFLGDSFMGVLCTDNNKPYMHYEALKSEVLNKWD